MTNGELLKNLSTEDTASFLAGLVLTATVSTLSSCGVDPKILDVNKTLKELQEQMMTTLNEEATDGEKTGSANLHSNQ